MITDLFKYHPGWTLPEFHGHVVISVVGLVGLPITRTERHVGCSLYKLTRALTYHHEIRMNTLLLYVGILVGCVHVQVRLVGVNVHLVFVVLEVLIPSRLELLVIISVGRVHQVR